VYAANEPKDLRPKIYQYLWEVIYTAQTYELFPIFYVKFSPSQNMFQIQFLILTRFTFYAKHTVFKKFEVITGMTMKNAILWHVTW
jgi:hypothetical protein